MNIPVPTKLGYVPIKTLYTPSMPVTIVSPINVNSLIRQHNIQGTTLLKENDTFQYTVHHRLRNSESIHLHGISINNLCYTPPAIPTNIIEESPVSNIHTEITVHQLSKRTERMLWHQRLAHCGDQYLYNAHKHINGVPKFSRQDPIIDNCPTCMMAKLRKRNIETIQQRPTTEKYESIQLDIGFTGQTSKNEKSRQQNYKGYNGETCCLLIHDQHTKQISGECFVTKGAP